MGNYNIFDMITPITVIKDPKHMHVLLLCQNTLCHIPLYAFLQPLEKRIADLEALIDRPEHSL